MPANSLPEDCPHVCLPVHTRRLSLPGAVVAPFFFLECEHFDPEWVRRPARAQTEDGGQSPEPRHSGKPDARHGARKGMRHAGPQRCALVPDAGRSGYGIHLLPSLRGYVSRSVTCLGRQGQETSERQRRGRPLCLPLPSDHKRMNSTHDESTCEVMFDQWVVLIPHAHSLLSSSRQWLQLECGCQLVTLQLERYRS